MGVNNIDINHGVVMVNKAIVVILIVLVMAEIPTDRRTITTIHGAITKKHTVQPTPAHRARFTGYHETNGWGLRHALIYISMVRHLGAHEELLLAQVEGEWRIEGQLCWLLLPS